MNWEKVAIDEVICSFLKSEYEKTPTIVFSKEELNLINNPDFNDNIENQEREGLLLHKLRRRPLWDKIPKDTEWWRVGPIDLQLMKRIHVIDKPGGGWTDLFEPDSSLEAVVRNLHQDSKKNIKINRIMDSLRGDPQIINNSTILFSHSKNGHFTIIEGNHRWCALMLHAKRGKILKSKIYSYVGISRENCHWHFED